MSSSRKRKLRLTIALSVALVLAGALVYTSFSAATEAQQPSQLLQHGKSGQVYDLTGEVARGSVRRGDDVLAFRVRDRHGSASVPVRYAGAVPDPFREGREVIVTGKLDNGVFIGERDSLVTKCPSKFSKPNSS